MARARKWSRPNPAVLLWYAALVNFILIERCSTLASKLSCRFQNSGLPMNPHMYGWTWSEIGFEDWRNIVDLRLEEVYAITTEDAGFEDEFLKSHWEEKEPPFEFVRWFSEKYDLEPTKPVWLYPDQVIPPRHH
jgi:hypothetical protein